MTRNLRERVSLPISAGVAWACVPSLASHTLPTLSSFAAVMLDFTGLFPECSDFTVMRLHQQLYDCRQHLLQQQADLQKAAP